MSKYLGVTAFVIVVLGIILYSYFGGFKSPEINVSNIENTSFWGKQFSGTIHDKGYGELFEEMEAIAEKTNEPLCAIYFTDPDKNSGKVDVFIGFKKETDNYNKIEIKGGNTIKAVLNASYMIIPFKIYPKITEFAKANNLKTTETAIETYVSDKELVIEVLLED
jgi:effector-binding domain-containing protein